MEEPYVVVAVKSRYHESDEVSYSLNTFSLFHGPDTEDGCECVKGFMESDKAYSWSTLYYVTPASTYFSGQFKQ